MAELAFINWLLDAQTPSIRYLTLSRLLGHPVDERRVQQAHRAIMSEGPVPAILAGQTSNGPWANEHSYYTPKYISTHWSLLLLAELNVDSDAPPFQRGVTYMLDATQNRLAKSLETNDHGFSCFWGDILRYTAHAGMGDDERARAIVQYAVRDLREGHCRCEINQGYSCGWGVARTLWGLAACSADDRAPEVNDAIERGLVFLLDMFNLVEANYPTPDNGKIHPLWFKLNFPLFYQADILFTLRTLADLNALDHPGAQAALDWLETRRGANGRWQGTSPYRRRTWPEMGGREETDRWVSLQAALILQQAGRFNPPEN